MFFDRSWFVTGINSVMKNLEKDQLRLVLICKTMQPSVMKKAILHLVNQKRCPALCVSDLLLHLQKSWPGLSSAAAFGVLVSSFLSKRSNLRHFLLLNIPFALWRYILSSSIFIPWLLLLENLWWCQKWIARVSENTTIFFWPYVTVWYLHSVCMYKYLQKCYCLNVSDNLFDFYRNLISLMILMNL